MGLPDHFSLDHNTIDTCPVRLLGLVALVLVIALAAGFYSMYRQRFSLRRQALAPHRLAILPFQNLRQDPDSDFLGYYFADAVITKLGYVRELQVRPSYASGEVS